MNAKGRATLDRVDRDENPEHVSMNGNVGRREEKSIPLSPTEGAINKPGEHRDLDAKMRTVSLVFSVVAFGLMIYGFADAAAGSGFTIPGEPAVSPAELARLRLTAVSLSCMSAGIVLLAALPTVRVVMAIWLYTRAHDFFNAAVAVVVLLELLVSLHFGV